MKKWGKKIEKIVTAFLAPAAKRGAGTATGHGTARPPPSTAPARSAAGPRARRSHAAAAGGGTARGGRRAGLPPHPPVGLPAAPHSPALQSGWGRGQSAEGSVRPLCPPPAPPPPRNARIFFFFLLRNTKITRTAPPSALPRISPPGARSVRAPPPPLPSPPPPLHRCTPRPCVELSGGRAGALPVNIGAAGPYLRTGPCGARSGAGAERGEERSGAGPSGAHGSGGGGGRRLLQAPPPAPPRRPPAPPRPQPPPPAAAAPCSPAAPLRAPCALLAPSLRAAPCALFARSPPRCSPGPRGVGVGSRWGAPVGGGEQRRGGG